MSEALRLRPCHLVLAASPPQIRIQPSKARLGPGPPLVVTEPLHPAALRWADAFCRAFPCLPQPLSRHTLNPFLQLRLPPSAPPTARWHALRRGVVTTAALLGDDSPARQRRGRWRSSAIARQYVQPIRPDAHADPTDSSSDSSPAPDCVPDSANAAQPLAPAATLHTRPA
jgi:hypothetical protein